MKRISDAYPEAKRINIILDNLNTHRLKSLADAYGETKGRRLWRRFVPRGPAGPPGPSMQADRLKPAKTA